MELIELKRLIIANSITILICIGVMHTAIAAFIEKKMNELEKNLLNEVAFRQEKVSNKLDFKTEEIVQAIDDTDQVQAIDLAEILDKLDKMPQELKEATIKQLIIPTLANRKGI